MAFRFGPAVELAGAAAAPAGVRIRVARGGRAERGTWRDLEGLDWGSYGLVLGGGGATGAVFHAGVLLALGTDHGISLAGASRIVGTSSGAIAATLAAHGCTAEDLAAAVAGAPHHLTATARSLNVEFRPGAPTLPGLRRLFRPVTRRDLARVCSHAVQRRYRAMLISALRTGEYDLRPDLAYLAGASWPTPTDRLAVCVTDSALGARRVLRHADGVDLLESVVASCALPAVLRAGELDGAPYLDGGLCSPTNADVLAGRDQPDVVLVVSPLSGTSSRTFAGRVMARYAARRLARELRAFGPRQTVVVVEPTDRLSELILDDVGGGGSYADILRAAFIGPSVRTT